MGQNHPPLNEIPTASENVTTGNIIARMVQGLGYRYYWATKDLRIKDLSYRPSEEASSCFETLEHIYGLAEVIRNTATSSPSIRPVKSPPKDYVVLREKTLEYLEQASVLFLNKTIMCHSSLSLLLFFCMYYYRHSAFGPPCNTR